jgi:transposase InsO family protein
VLEEGWTLQQAAEAAGCSVRTAAKWLKRFRDGDLALVDRSSRPRRSPARLPADRVRAVELLRRLRMTAVEIAEVLGIPLSTVSLWLRRIGLGKRSRLAPPEPPNRYERRHPGELVHVDIKQLGRVRGVGHRISGSRAPQKRTRLQGRLTGVAGWEYVHVMVDDYTRIAYAEVLDDLTASCAIAFLRRAVAWFADRGVQVKAVMTDNGSCYRADAHRVPRSSSSDSAMSGSDPAAHAPTARRNASSRHCSTKWAYARIYGSSPERTATLPLFLERYNHRRPHGSLAKKAPATRLNNLVRNYT